MPLFYEGPEDMAITRRRDSGAWQVTVGDHRHSDRHWSRADALRYEAEYLQARQESSHTLDEALDLWISDYLPDLKARRNYLNKVRQVRPYLHKQPITAAPDIARQMKRDWQHLKPATINRRLAILKRLVTLAYDEWNWIEQPIAKKIKLIREDNARHYYLSRAEVERLRMNCHNPYAGDLIVFAAFTGLRKSEMFRMTSRNVVDGVLRLDARTKTGKPRSIPLHPRALSIAQRLPFPITEKTLFLDWDQARKQAALRHIHWHDLRHTFASWLIQAGVPLNIVKTLLGHSNINTTMRYAHLAPENFAAAIEKLDPNKLGNAEDEDEDEDEDE